MQQLVLYILMLVDADLEKNIAKRTGPTSSSSQSALLNFDQEVIKN